MVRVNLDSSDLDVGENVSSSVISDGLGGKDIVVAAELEVLCSWRVNLGFVASINWLLSVLSKVHIQFYLI